MFQGTIEESIIIYNVRQLDVETKCAAKSLYPKLINHVSTCFTIWVWVNTYRYIFSGMNIHLPAILGFTRCQGFDPSPTKELSSDADDPRRLHPFIALAARHPCNLNPRAPVHHRRLERSILKCIPSTNNVLPEVTVDVCMFIIIIFLNNNQFLSHIVKNMSLISLWQC